MDDTPELLRITQMLSAAMHISTDPVTAAGAAHLPSLELSRWEQGVHLARCIAAFTTDDALANDLAELIGESPKVLIGKVGLANPAPQASAGESAEVTELTELEKRIWTLIYAGRRERSRVQQTLARRSLI